MIRNSKCNVHVVYSSFKCVFDESLFNNIMQYTNVLSPTAHYSSKLMCISVSNMIQTRILQISRAFEMHKCMGVPKQARFQ